MKFLVDECAGRHVFNWLKKGGHDAIFVKDEFCGASDDLVLEKAFRENRILITCDKDFGDMVFRDQKKHKGIVLLRVLDESAENKIRIICWVLENHKDKLEGNFLLASDNNIRIVQVKR